MRRSSASQELLLLLPQTCKPFTTALVVERGGTINAAGTAALPITFTANAATADLPNEGTTETDSASGTVIQHGTRGNWGGLIILGNAPVTGSVPGTQEGDRNIEGLAVPTPCECASSHSVIPVGLGC